MSFQIDRGLAKFDCVDYHAILGIPIDAEANEARKRYMKIARSLHPDSCTEENKQLASQLLSKLVNPAYEKLSQARDRAEHELLLQLLGQRVAQERDTVELQAELAKQLLQAKNPETSYKTAVQDLAAKQYQSIDQALELTEQLSELNLAFLIAKEGKGNRHPNSVATGGTTSATPSTSSKPNSASFPMGKPGPSTDTFVGQYYRRAEEFLAKNNFQKAMLELRDALKLEPNNSRCHGLIGMVYLKQNQTTMARVHFNQALKADPKNPMALSGRSQLDKLDPKAKSKASMSQKRDRGGLFGLFGGKKK
jgi:curved DNA-binding protein CbpA